MKYSVHVPSKSDYEKRFSTDIKYAETQKELKELEYKRAMDQRNQACNQAVLDKIAADTKKFGIRSWTFEFDSCDYDPEIGNTLTKKGYHVNYKINVDDVDDDDECAFRTLKVKL